jgi:predicted HNH restriction endonuclease
MKKTHDMKQYMNDWFVKNNTNPEWKAARNKQRAQLRRNNKRKAVEYMGGVCAICGQTFPDCCYDFHHKDPTKVNDVPSTVLHCSWKRIVVELAKCIMVCSNCHRIIHNEDGYIAHEKRT